MGALAAAFAVLEIQGTPACGADRPGVDRCAVTVQKSTYNRSDTETRRAVAPREPVTA